MTLNIDNLKRLIESIKTIGLFQRIFTWNKIRQQLIDGVADIQKMESAIEHLNLHNQKLSNEATTINAELKSAKTLSFKTKLALCVFAITGRPLSSLKISLIFLP
jgi:hypothetical protein